MKVGVYRDLIVRYTLIVLSMLLYGDTFFHRIEHIHVFGIRGVYDLLLPLWIAATIAICSIIFHTYKQPYGRWVVPWTIVLMGVLLHYVNISVIGTTVISEIALLVTLYGIAGLRLPLGVWRRMSRWRGVWVLLLPIVDHLQVFVWFPLRLGTSHVIYQLLNMMWVDAVSHSTVLVVERRVADVALACSGISTLYWWAFFACLTWFLSDIKRWWRSILSGLAFACCLVYANAVRIFFLTYLRVWVEQYELAEKIHVWLGLIWFVCSCIAWMLLLSRCKKKEKLWAPAEGIVFSHKAKHALQYILIVAMSSVLCLQLLLYAWSDKWSLAQIDWSGGDSYWEDVGREKLPLADRDSAFFTAQRAEYVWSFLGEYEGIPYSLFIVTSDDAWWQHNPEICLQWLWHTIDTKQAYPIGERIVTHVSTNDSEYAILYWFVDRDGNIVHDYAQRVWEWARSGQKEWTLIILWLPGEVDLQSQSLEILTKNLTDRAIESMRDAQ